VLAIREKVFQELSEDVWFLYADGYGGKCDKIGFSKRESFRPEPTPPRVSESIARSDWESWNERLRPFLLPRRIREVYRKVAKRDGADRLGQLAKVGIGYVTGANDFFHLRPSEAKEFGIPDEFLIPAVRKSSYLPLKELTRSTVEKWISSDEPVLLLHVPADCELPKAVRSYLDTAEAQRAQATYKCRVRTPWYTVPDVRVPDAFLSYMSGLGPNLVVNSARCVCTNSIHAVHLTHDVSPSQLERRWRHPLVSPSCELEGHPLGGGMLKLEPREAANVVLPPPNIRLSRVLRIQIDEGVALLRRWRHYA
jgi:hypothetical protein